MMSQITLHPDDLLFFNEVRSAMFRVAKAYELPLKSVEPYPMPRTSMADRLGDCNASGNIRIVLRCTVDGTFCEDPMSPEEVWNTAAHELAHLAHLNHGHQHAELTLELRQALRNTQEDHRAKVLKRLVKLQAQRDDARKRATSEEAKDREQAAHEAEAFASMINKMLIENELSPTDIDYARASDDDPVIEIRVNLETYGIKKSKHRIAWQNTMARIVADAHLCTYLVSEGRNQIWFVGTRSHAMVAEYVWGTLVPMVERMSEQARRDFRNQCRRDCNYTKMDGFPEAYGYREAWINAFTQRISERFREAREAAVREAEERMRETLKDVPGTQCTALLRLDQQMVKVRKYMDDKFKSKRGASALAERYSRNEAGRQAGRAAADRMVIGRRALTASLRKTSGLLGE